MKKPIHEIVGIGHSHVEQLSVVDRYPEPGARIELAGFSLQWGGTIATSLSAMATMGVRSKIISKIGDDDLGKFLIRGCTELGIDTTGIVIEEGKISPNNITLIERDSHRNTILSTAGSVSLLKDDEFELEELKGARLLIVDGSHYDVQIKAVEYARDEGIVVVLHAGQITEGMGELMALSDVLIASERYASEVAPRGEIEDSLFEITKLGPETVVVKLGAEGSIGLKGEKLVRQPPLDVEVVDTTGSGDIFLGGYCIGLLRKDPLERCMQLANAAAGLSVKHIGPLGGLATLQEVEAVC